SEDAYSYSQAPARTEVGRYVSYVNFNISSFGKSEVHDLRKRLSAELVRVRDFRHWIESGQFPENPRSETKFNALGGNKMSAAGVGFAGGNLTNGLHPGFGPVNSEGVLKECAAIITKLLKHKGAVAFKAPVDVVGLGLHDYHFIVKQPMDLGTVKTKLANGLYATAPDFAADVRLTFNNAMLYNPATHHIHWTAKEMLAKFDKLFSPIQDK
ncbi:hypothetical protein M569_06610, partial [Genlisea aurea]